MPAFAAFLFLSCDKITGDGDDPSSKTDIKLVGSWNVIKYEAYDTRDSLIMTMTSQDSIYQSFYRFDFDVNCSSQTGLIVWVNGKPTLGMDYSYENSMIRFGGIEYAPADLSDLSLSFKTGFFAPTSWISGQRLKDPIDKVKVYCTKLVSQEQSF